MTRRHVARLTAVLLATVTAVAGVGATSSVGARASAAATYYSIVARHSGKRLDVSGASQSDGAGAIQWPCHGGYNQQWSFR